MQGLHGVVVWQRVKTWGACGPQRLENGDQTIRSRYVTRVDVIFKRRAVFFLCGRKSSSLYTQQAPILMT